MSIVEPLLILAMAAFDLAGMPWRIWANQLMTNTKLGGGLLKQRLQVVFAVAEPIREFKAVIGLYALHPKSAEE